MLTNDECCALTVASAGACQVLNPTSIQDSADRYKWSCSHNRHYNAIFLWKVLLENCDKSKSISLHRYWWEKILHLKMCFPSNFLVFFVLDSCGQKCRLAASANDGRALKLSVRGRSSVTAALGDTLPVSLRVLSDALCPGDFLVPVQESDILLSTQEPSWCWLFQVTPAIW